MQQILEISKKLAHETTVYGLARIIKAKTIFMKLIWLIMTVISLSVGIYVISQTIVDYQMYDVLTLTKRIVPDSPILMPSVIFCTTSPDLYKLFQSSVYRAKNMTMFNMTGEIFKPNLKIGNTTCIKFNNYFKDAGSGALFSTNDMNNKFIFTINESVFANFWVDVFISDNYLNDIDWSEFITTVNPRKSVSNYMYINLKKTKETKIGYPYNQPYYCDDETTDKAYRYRNCLLQCQNKLFLRNYNCTLINYYSVVGYAYCDQIRLESTEFKAVCDKECPLECTLIMYSADLSYSDRKDLPQSIRVQFADISYFETSQTPQMTGFNLMNEIGGALGLFIGISFMSLLELLEFLSEIFLVYYYVRVANMIC